MTINLKELFSTSEQSNEKVLLKLFQAVKAAQSQDFDYLRFKHSYKSLLDMGMDEPTAAKSAFVTASTIGFTKEKLIHSLNAYKVILSKEREEFAKALKHQIATNVDSRSIEINHLNQRHQSNIQKIEDLHREQEIINQKISQLKAESEINLTKINETRDQFKDTYDHIVKEIEEDDALYNQFL